MNNPFDIKTILYNKLPDLTDSEIETILNIFISM